MRDPETFDCAYDFEKGGAILAGIIINDDISSQTRQFSRLLERVAGTRGLLIQTFNICANFPELFPAGTYRAEIDAGYSLNTVTVSCVAENMSDFTLLLKAFRAEGFKMTKAKLDENVNCFRWKMKKEQDEEESHLIEISGYLDSDGACHIERTEIREEEVPATTRKVYETRVVCEEGIVADEVPMSDYDIMSEDEQAQADEEAEALDIALKEQIIVESEQADDEADIS